jgi:hypothetical protein
MSLQFTVCVSGFWAGVENVWEQKKLEARKMLVNCADSQKSAARFVRRFFFALIDQTITPLSLLILCLA